VASLPGNQRYSREDVKAVMTSFRQTGTADGDVAHIMNATRGRLSATTVRGILHQFHQSQASGQSPCIVRDSSGNFLFPKGFGDNSERISRAVAQASLKDPELAQHRDWIKRVGNAFNDSFDGSDGQRLDLSKSPLDPANIAVMKSHYPDLPEAMIVRVLTALGVPNPAAPPA
jgi:hypothetical protein